MTDTADDDRIDSYYQRRSTLISIVSMLSVLLILLVIAVFFGSGFEASSRDPLWAALAVLVLVAVIAGVLWILWKRPVVLTVGPKGIQPIIAFRRPLAWREIHRIRRSRGHGSLTGRRDWLVIDPLPGVLAPLRMPVWRALELRLQKHHGVRIPLHGLEGDPDEVVQSVERFRPVVSDH